MSHYISVHNIQPSEEFVDLIFRTRFDPLVLSRTPSKRIKGVVIEKENKKYLKITRNQMFIIDALMKHGSYKHYVDKFNKNIFRYSEHAGVIDFDSIGVEKIIVSGKTTRIDKGDEDIFQPRGMVDMYDYEYIFHTHPATPKPGGRVNLGILYEFPSISDLFHFMDHYNQGTTQGSLVIAPEGLYVIKKVEDKLGKININEDDFFNKAKRIYNTVQNDAIKKYGTKFSYNEFYTKIAPDKYYINRINNVINKFDMHIEYYYRVKDKMGRWVIDTVYLPIYVVEAKSKLEKEIEYIQFIEQMR